MKSQQRKAALEKSDALIKQMQEAKQDGEKSIEHLLNDGKSQTETKPAADEEGKATGQEATPPAAKQESSDQGEQQPSTSDKVSKAEYDRLEHAHKVLQGKYNAEIQPLHEQIRQLRDRIAELEAKPETPEKQDTSLDAIRDKLLDEFPEDVVDAMLKLGAQRQQQVDPDLKKRLDRLEGLTREQRLEQKVPDWKEIQAHPGWIPYLQERNAESGLERNDHLQHAWANEDLSRVASIFDGFRPRMKQQAPKTTDEPPIEPQTRSSAPRTSPDDKKFTRQEIDAFYSQLRNRQIDIRDPKVRALRDSIEEFLANQQAA